MGVTTGTMVEKYMVRWRRLFGGMYPTNDIRRAVNSLNSLFLVDIRSLGEKYLRYL